MTYCREYPISDELADRWNALGEAIDAWGRQIDDAQAAHRADCIKRYGPDFDCPVGEGEERC